MTETQRRLFISALCETVQKDVLSKASRMPEEWDGREPREFIADSFEQCRMPIEDRKRRKAYRNEVVVRNL